MRLPKFTILEPSSLAEALALLSSHHGAVIKAGGTDLLPRLKLKLSQPKFLVNLRGLSDLDFIRRNGRGELCIGALTSLRRIELSPLVRDHFEALADGVAHIASIEIRHTGTLGGNICLDTRCQFYNQSPLFRKATNPCLKSGGSQCYISKKGNRCHALFCSDTVPLLIAADARVKVVSSGGEDIIPLQDFYTGEGKSPHALSTDQIVAEIQVPEAVQEARAAYLKFRFREGIDFPVVGVAVLAINGGSQRTSRGVRIVVSGATSGPFRCVKAERMLENGKIGNADLEKVGERAAGETPIVSTSGCSVSYRRTLVKELVIRGARRVLS
ncbi:MAG: hypothetical protein GTN81_12655 [Proteobacteria bacterium]|nr:hypothetical protein [Pseudomonadota bacterium]